MNYGTIGQILLISLIILVCLFFLTLILIKIIESKNNKWKEYIKQKISEETSIIKATTGENSDGKTIPNKGKANGEVLVKTREPGANYTQTEDEPAKPYTPGPRIVINSKTSYKPEPVDTPLDFPGKNPNPNEDEQHFLILRKSAQKKLYDALDWGKLTRQNKVEQGGVLLGKVSRYRNEVYCFVNDILIAGTTGSSVFVEFSSGMWADMQQSLSEINTQLNKSEQLAIVGWFHTHPNNLPVFMSGTDMRTQRLNFSEDWQASLVLNPHLKTGRAFFGKKATIGKIVITDSYG